MADESEEPRRSKYFKALDNEHASRYLQKIALIENTDPYTLKKEDLSTDILLFPAVAYPDIVNYFLFAPSPLTSEQLKCYKSLDSYYHFLSGWVKEISVKVFDKEKTLVTGRVSNSKIFFTFTACLVLVFDLGTLGRTRSQRTFKLKTMQQAFLLQIRLTKPKPYNWKSFPLTRSILAVPFTEHYLYLS